MVEQIPSAERWAMDGFAVLLLLNVALRLYAKARKARLRLRGEVHHPQLLNQMVVAYLIFCAMAFGERQLQWVSFHWPMAFFGFGLYGLATFFQWQAFHDLGEAYSPDIEVRPEQPLVKKGIYRWVRHPLLSSLLLELLAVTLFFNAYVTAVLVWIGFLPVLRKRMQAEEQVLRSHFGEAYQCYALQVGGLFPKLFT